MGILAFRFSGTHTHWQTHRHTLAHTGTLSTYSHGETNDDYAIGCSHSHTATETVRPAPLLPYSLSPSLSQSLVCAVSLMRAFLWAFCIIHHRQTCLQSVYEYYMGI